MACEQSDSDGCENQNDNQRTRNSSRYSLASRGIRSSWTIKSSDSDSEVKLWECAPSI